MGIKNLRFAAKEYDMAQTDFINYIYDSYINGQRKQAKELFTGLNEEAQNAVIMQVAEQVAPGLFTHYDTAYLIKNRYSEFPQYPDFAGFMKTVGV